MKISLKSIPAIVLIAFVFSILLTAVTGAPLLVGFLASVLFSFVPMPKGVSFMALQKEIWRNDIVANLYKDNQFAQYAINADTFVLGGAVVHIPVAGAATGIGKNLNVFPQVATERADTELTYPLDTFYALPRRIAQIDKYELSYDKRMSVVGEDIKKLCQVACDSILFNWGPLVANTILTTGADSGADLIDATATGTRKMFNKAEVKRIVKLWAKANVTGSMYAELTPAHYYQLIESLSEQERTDVGRVMDMKTGVIGQYMGVKLMMRSTVLRYRGADGAYVKVDENATGFVAATTDRAASLFWVDTAVERALGDVEVFDNPGQALYYGDVFSAMVRMGGRIRRTPGVYAVVEAIGA